MTRRQWTGNVLLVIGHDQTSPSILLNELKLANLQDFVYSIPAGFKRHINSQGGRDVRSSRSLNRCCHQGQEQDHEDTSTVPGTVVSAGDRWFWSARIITHRGKCLLYFVPV